MTFCFPLVLSVRSTSSGNIRGPNTCSLLFKSKLTREEGSSSYACIFMHSEWGDMLMDVGKAVLTRNTLTEGNKLLEGRKTTTENYKTIRITSSGNEDAENKDKGKQRQYLLL